MTEHLQFPTLVPSVILDACPLLSSSTLVIEDPGSLSSQREEKAKTLDPRSFLPRAIKWRHLKAPAGAAAPRSRILFGGRGLFERSEFRSPNLRDRGKGTPSGRARAPMVLDPFAETKGSRRAGAKPCKHFFPSVILEPSKGHASVILDLPTLSFPTFPICHSRPDRESSLFLFHFFCIRTRRIPGQSPGHASCGPPSLSPRAIPAQGQGHASWRCPFLGGLCKAA